MNLGFKLLLAFFLVARAATAEIMVAPSLEWLTCKAEVIVVGKIKGITVTKGRGSVIFEDCVVGVEQTLKGNVTGKRVEFTLRKFNNGPSVNAFVNSKDGAIFFLSQSKDHGSERHLDGKLVPTSLSMQMSVFDLSKPQDKIYSKEMKFVRNKKEILATVRQWSMSPVKHSLWSEVPFDSPIFKKLWAGSSVYLLVPAEEKFRGKFMKLARSQNPHERAKAAGELQKFPGPETEAVLRELMKDDAESFSYYSADQIGSVIFHVRLAASRSLKALGKPVPDIQLRRAPTKQEHRDLRVKYWTQSIKEGLKENWTITVNDGASRVFNGLQRTIVVVSCKQGDRMAKFTLVPKEWPANERPKNGYLGINGKKTQGARHFFLSGDLPDDVQKRFVQYFGLVK
ncbi:MAG: HEAT repeat domain-containing protein [Planctomycetes bacterium]|nr:HEAT repeat domain-containing protein [Planctomycetota bacterium]